MEPEEGRDLWFVQRSRGNTFSHSCGLPWVRNIEHKLPREDRFTWRHNNLLFHLAKVVGDHVKVANASRPAKQRQAADSLIRFVRPGQSVRKSYRKTKPPSLLDVASDWRFGFDLQEFRPPGSTYVFPHVVCQPLCASTAIIYRKLHARALA